MKNHILVVAIGLITGLGIAAFVFCFLYGKTSDGAQDHRVHKAHHNGCLNAIENCDIGHVEVKIEDDTIHFWFVGGGHDTGKSIRIPNEKINLTINSRDGDKLLVLKPAPIELAGEKTGACSHFIAQAEWLKDLDAFKATSSVKFKGGERRLVIDYPKGYAPDHKHEGHDH